MDFSKNSPIKDLKKTLDRQRDATGKFVSKKNMGLTNIKSPFKKNDKLSSFPGFKKKDFSGDNLIGDSPMFKNKKCTPTTFYLIFAGIQIFMDLINGIYDAAVVKFIIMIVFSTLLNILCMRNLGIISWILVFMPFILTTLISALVLDSMNNNGKGTSINTDYINFNII